MGKLILVRHGETNKNIHNNLHALNDSEGLNNTGIQQIKKVADTLVALAPDKIYSSKERRALESANILSESLKVPFQEIDGLQERNWGVFTGKPWQEIQKILNPMALEERYTYVPKGGESWKTFETRLINVVKKITEDNPNKTIIVVTHGGVIRALIPFLLGVSRSVSFKYDFDNASLTVFDFGRNEFTNVIMNDISHLKSS